MAPPAAQAVRNGPAPVVAPATRAGVRKMPIPITRLTITIAVSKTDSFGSSRGIGASLIMQGLAKQGRERPVLLLVVVDLRRQAHHLSSRAWPGEEPRLDAALPRPGRQRVLSQAADRRAGSGSGERQGGHRSDQVVRAGWGETQSLQADVSAPKHQRMVALHERPHAPREGPAEDPQALRYRQAGGRVVGPGPRPFLAEAER